MQYVVIPLYLEKHFCQESIQNVEQRLENLFMPKWKNYIEESLKT
jgi:hypothetical protein